MLCYIEKWYRLHRKFFFSPSFNIKCSINTNFFQKPLWQLPAMIFKILQSKIRRFYHYETLNIAFDVWATCHLKLTVQSWRIKYSFKIQCHWLKKIKRLYILFAIVSDVSSTPKLRENKKLNPTIMHVRTLLHKSGMKV